MLDMLHSRLYAKPEEAELLKNEQQYVIDRYLAVIKTMLVASFRWTRQQAATHLNISKRHMQRLVRAYLTKGIPGLRLKSKRPKESPNKSSERIEKAVVSMKKLTGFGGDSISDLVNEKFRHEGYDKRITPILAYRISLRNKLQHPPENIAPKIKHFDWKRPNNLLQSDLTYFNKVPILTMEDDHSRYAWSDILDDISAETVTKKMHDLAPFKYNNLLTDNGTQFSKKNKPFLYYLAKHVRKRHIRSSFRHPQTLGKISSYQGNLKNFLEYQVGDSEDPNIIRTFIKAYDLFHNNGHCNRTTSAIPAEAYSGRKDTRWFSKMMQILKSRSSRPHFTEC
jgi:transposase InsO family protein